MTVSNGSTGRPGSGQAPTDPTPRGQNKSTPNGRGKVPVGPNYVVRASAGTTTLRTFRGELVDYLDPPV